MTPTEKKQNELFELLQQCGYTYMYAEARLDIIIECEVSRLSDYDWWIAYYKFLYGDMLMNKGIITQEEYEKAKELTS